MADQVLDRNFRIRVEPEAGPQDRVPEGGPVFPVRTGFGDEAEAGASDVLASTRDGNSGDGSEVVEAELVEELKAEKNGQS